MAPVKLPPVPPVTPKAVWRVCLLGDCGGGFKGSSGDFMVDVA